MIVRPADVEPPAATRVELVLDDRGLQFSGFDLVEQECF
jgi:hypothetical protein